VRRSGGGTRPAWRGAAGLRAGRRRCARGRISARRRRSSFMLGEEGADGGGVLQGDLLRRELGAIAVRRVVELQFIVSS
jgi:hypothetical protein